MSDLPPTTRVRHPERSLPPVRRPAPWRARGRNWNDPEPVIDFGVAPIANAGGLAASERAEAELRLLTFNIQSGISTARFRHYFTHGWKHVLPHGDRERNLRQIAHLVADYDLVALQEVDGGSLRSGFVNQVEYLAASARFPYWYAQLNRDFGLLAQHGNGLLSRVVPRSLEDHKLPGTIPGRGAIVLRLALADTEVLVVFLHLSLGPRSRQRQLSYVRELIHGHDLVILMGDMNSHLTSLLYNSPLATTGLIPAEDVQPTYPSWRPALALDHVLVTPGLQIRNYEVLDCTISDHRPLAVRIGLAPGQRGTIIQ
jgi:endonuclease/exonuclease/phosphatase family metal-dependent hydrolase